MRAPHILLPLVLACALLPTAGCGSHASSAAPQTPATASARASASAIAPLPSATASPTPTGAPAPSLARIESATIQVPEGCGTTSAVAFASGKYSKDYGMSVLDIAIGDSSAVVTINGQAARAVAFTCAAGDGAGGAIGVYDSQLRLVAQHALKPLGQGTKDSVLAKALPSTAMSWYPVVLRPGAAAGSLHATWTAYGQMAEKDSTFPAGATLDDLEADLVWNGSGFTASNPVLHSPLDTVDAVISALHAGKAPSTIKHLSSSAVSGLNEVTLDDGRTSAQILKTMRIADRSTCIAQDDMTATGAQVDDPAATTFTCTITSPSDGALGVTATARRTGPGSYTLTYLHVVTG